MAVAVVTGVVKLGLMLPSVTGALIGGAILGGMVGTSRDTSSSRPSVAHTQQFNPDLLMYSPANGYPAYGNRHSGGGVFWDAHHSGGGMFWDPVKTFGNGVKDGFFGFFSGQWNTVTSFVSDPIQTYKDFYTNPANIIKASPAIDILVNVVENAVSNGEILAEGDPYKIGYRAGENTGEAAETLTLLAAGKAAGKIAGKVASSKGSSGQVKYRQGQGISPIGKTYEMALNPEYYAKEVAKKYGINLKGSGKDITIKYNPNLRRGTYGRTTAANPYVIEIGPDALMSETELANTIAHELNHARDFIKGGGAPETPAYGSGNALSDYISGGR